MLWSHVVAILPDCSHRRDRQRTRAADRRRVPTALAPQAAHRRPCHVCSARALYAPSSAVLLHGARVDRQAPRDRVRVVVLLQSSGATSVCACRDHRLGDRGTGPSEAVLLCAAQHGRAGSRYLGVICAPRGVLLVLGQLYKLCLARVHGCASRVGRGRVACLPRRRCRRRRHGLCAAPRNGLREPRV
eukprot:Amastigsp_a2781_11.p2 type:complete len:188 gc:universal Amastigsp_a2781_11:111-674(+)